jgi:hypothetical protein
VASVGQIFAAFAGLHTAQLFFQEWASSVFIELDVGVRAVVIAFAISCHMQADLLFQHGLADFFVSVVRAFVDGDAPARATRIWTFAADALEILHIFGNRELDGFDWVYLFHGSLR